MDLAKLLAVLQEVNKTLELLNQIGLKVSGAPLDLHAVLGAFGVKL